MQLFITWLNFLVQGMGYGRNFRSNIMATRV